MSEQEYRQAPGLSNSAMKDLAVSPLRFWHRQINPNRPQDEPTPEMQLGTALHCAVLEPEEFDSRYACEVIPPENCLETIEDLRGFLRNRGVVPKGTRKAEIIEMVQSEAPDVPILDVLISQHARKNAGKLIFKLDDWMRIAGMAESLRSEPRVCELLSEGEAEVPMFATDPETGITLKARMDWVRNDCTVDLKTFTQKRGKSIDQSIADAIFYEAYYRQAFTYGLIRGWPATWSGEFVLVFVESEPPHEVRLRALRPKNYGEPNLYWERARVEVRGLIRTYDECMTQFGLSPWRYAQDVTALADEEMPALAY
jgi:hypothetical protein